MNDNKDKKEITLQKFLKYMDLESKSQIASNE